jgi:tRNA A-37 threonylcarbamoyl transferase component Bud32
VTVPGGSTALYVAAAQEARVRALGLAAVDGWESALAAGALASGRAPTVVIEAPGGARWRLKSMRRGGVAARLWRDRYPSAARLVATLAATVEAKTRGVPTAAAVALLVQRGPGALARGYMATEEIEPSEDLARCVRRGAADTAVLGATMAAVRQMHDRGVVHPDLNLGNVLLSRSAELAPEVWLVDFDRARCLEGPVPFALRQAAIRRLERSCAKLTGAPGAAGPGSEDLWYTMYAAGDRALEARLARGRWAGRMSLAFHRMGWKGDP